MKHSLAIFTALLLALFLSSSGDLLGAEKAVWKGGTDSNWNISTNWNNGQVPGSARSDDAVIQGKGTIVSVPTPVAAANEYSVEVSSGASLFIERDMPRISSMSVQDGASKVEQFESKVAIAGDLRVGDEQPASEPGEYRLRSGALTVGGLLEVLGRFTVDDAKATIRARNALLASGSLLKYDFDLDGVSPIQVEDQLTIEDGARIEVDLRGNTVGGNVVKLLEFSRLSGSFHPGNVVIRGQKNGKIVYATNSISVSFEDVVDHPETALWFLCGAPDEDGSELSRFQVNTGRRIRDLSSPDLRCESKQDGDSFVHHVSWTGSDVNGDSQKDTIRFDLRVAGFEGSAVSYGPSGASMTALGRKASAPSFRDGSWGVGKDTTLDTGESLRFSIENFSASCGSEARFEGFVSFELRESGRGNSHVLVIGEGENLQAAKSNSPMHVTVAPAPELILTSANDSRVAAGTVVLKLSSRFQPDTLDKDVEDYSTLPNGPYFRGSYPPQADQSNFPAWSWDRVQRWGSVLNGDLDPEYIRAMANHHQIVTVGNEFNDGAFEAAEAIKKANPETKILFYVNTGIFFGNYHGGYPVNDEWFRYTVNDLGEQEPQNIRRYRSFNHSYPELRQWWVKVAADAASHPRIDGIFVDKATDLGFELIDEDGRLTGGEGHVRSYCGLVSAAPKHSLIIGNTLRKRG
ncbi:MAG: putative glycoside hydrolase [Candidatus Sumerlaeota bacterium]|nr:putative glycoside hydrolase [Candidatus Sumerlaeota bacterium]